MHLGHSSPLGTVTVWVNLCVTVDVAVTVGVIG